MTLSIAYVIPLLILIGFLTSILSSIIGLGAGLVSIPLILLLVNSDTVVAKSIAYVSIFALSAFALYKYIRLKRFPQWDKTMLVGLGAVPISVISVLYIGPLLVNYKVIFNILFAALTVIVILLINFKDKIRINIPTYLLPVMGMIIGLSSGALGISGGVLFIPLLVIGRGMTLKDAAVNSIMLTLMISFANIMTGIGTGSYSHFESNGFPWYLPLIIIAGSIPGALIGPLISKRIQHNHVQLILNIVLSGVVVWEVTSAILISQGIM